MLPPELARLTPSMPARASACSATPLPSCSAFAYGLQPALAPPSRLQDRLPQFAECHADAATAHMHEKLDVCLARLHLL
eukprot:6210175-Pleurochrysis_carterae.AAC.2